MLKSIYSTILLIIFLSNMAQATVCDSYPNPCENNKSCSTQSDFVFEAVVSHLHEMSIIAPNYGKGGDEITKLKTATFVIEKWIKGERSFEPTQINFPIDKFYCSEIKPIFPELLAGARYRVYGVHYRSANYCSAYYSTEKSQAELTSCKSSARTEERYYWLVESIQ